MSTALASLVDAAVVLALGLAATAALRHRSAALRHAILATAIVCAFLMPAFELLLPHLPVVRWDEPASVLSSGPTLTSEDGISGAGGESGWADGDGVRWTMLLAGAWMAGGLVTFGGLLTGLARLARLRARCTPVTGNWRELTDELSRECAVGRHVTLLQSHDPSLLVTYGMRNPGIILPAGASNWTDDRRRTVLRHELAHIRRHDAAIQLAGELLRVVQPINPLVWVACRRLRQESEYACDDAVIGGGVTATDYATHLLAVAKQLSGRHVAWASAPAIAHPSTLERRIVAMLQTCKHREPLTRRGWYVAALIALGVSLPLAAAGIAPSAPVVPGSGPIGVAEVTPVRPAEPTPPPAVAAPAGKNTVRRQVPAITGRVLDQSGGTLPGVQVTLTGSKTNAQFVAQTDAAGRFAFRDLPPAEYTLVARLAGFGTVRAVVTLSADAAIERTITLPIGSLSETIHVRCATSPRSLMSVIFPVLSAQEPPAGPIRVGGSVREPRKIKDVRPTCPPGGTAGDTTIRLRGRVGVDGFMYEVAPVPAEPGAVPPAELVEAGLDAVRQWKFTPTLLNGQPVEVTITVEIVFMKS